MQHLQNTASQPDCQSPIGVFVGRETGRVFTAKCRRESCKGCGPHRRKSFVARTIKATYLVRELAIDTPLLGATRENIGRLRKCSTNLKRWLDRRYGYAGKPAWSREVGDHGYLHQHGLVGDYGYIDFTELNDWMIAHGYYVLIDGRKVPWRTHYRWLQNVQHGARYMAKYIAKGSEVDWPRYTRIRYTPIAENKHTPSERFDLRRSALPYFTAQRAVNPEWGQLVADCDFRVAKLTQPLNRQKRFERRLTDDLEQIDIRHANTAMNWHVLNYLSVFCPLSLSIYEIRSQADEKENVK